MEFIAEESEEENDDQITQRRLSLDASDVEESGSVAKTESDEEEALTDDGDEFSEYVPSTDEEESTEDDCEGSTDCVSSTEKEEASTDDDYDESSDYTLTGDGEEYSELDEFNFVYIMPEIFICFDCHLTGN